jgi:hypothetical protein
MKTMKKVLVIGAATIALILSGCAGDYVVGTYVPGAYGGPYYGPYYGPYGPYDGGEFIIGGYHYHHHYGWHHFYGYGFGARHFGGGFHH